MNDAPLDDTTRTISWFSYVLHLVVAVSAVVPGAQMGPLLLIVAWVMDLVKRGDALDWEASHFSYRIRTVIWAVVLYAITFPLWFLFMLPGWLGLGSDFHLVFVPHRAGHGAFECPTPHGRLTHKGFDHDRRPLRVLQNHRG